MNMFKRLPYFVYLQERKIKINVDFRNMVSFEKVILDKGISKDEKIKKILNILQCFYPIFFKQNEYMRLITDKKLYKEAVEKLIWFYKCGREDYHKPGKGTVSSNQIYNYDYDDEYIYGAFYEQYGIDLAYDRVHWWKFKALLKSLKDDTEFVKIKSYRAYKGKDKNMNELKEYWTLPISSAEKDRRDNLYKMLKEMENK